MASISQSLVHMYNLAMVFFSLLLLELAIFVSSAARTTTHRSITTEQFLKIVDQKAPAHRHKLGQDWVEPLECRVCLSIYEEGDEIRKLKCEHTFHKGCLDTWLQEDSATCPLCRRSILPEEVVVKHRRHRNHHDYYHDGRDEELRLFYRLHGNFMGRFL